MPNVEFFYGEDGFCTIETKYGIHDSGNNKCVQEVAYFLKQAERKYLDSRLIYITHGFLYNGESWLPDMKDSLLRKYPKHNTAVAIVNWIKGAGGVQEKISAPKNGSGGETGFVHQTICCGTWVNQGYGPAAANTWPIGNVLGYLHQAIISSNKHFKTDTYCIGYSLGSHLCGFFGKVLKEMAKKEYFLKKIVALDPAGPIFEYPEQDSTMRLNKNDATMVEVIHTNYYNWGYENSLGDLDFYINGGSSQPWCSTYGDIRSACSHSYSYKLITEVKEKRRPCILTQDDKVFHLGNFNKDSVVLRENYDVETDENSQKCRILESKALRGRIQYDAQPKNNNTTTTKTQASSKKYTNAAKGARIDQNSFIAIILFSHVVQYVKIHVLRKMF